MAQIFLLSSNVNVWFEADKQTSATLNYDVKTLNIDDGSNIKGRLVFEQPITFPGLILGPLDPEVPDAEKITLKTWKQVVDDANDESRRHAAAALDKLYQDLRKCKIKANGSDYNDSKSEFLGITGIAAAETEFHIEINPTGMLPNGIGDKEPIFRAEAKAMFTSGFKSPFAVTAVDAVVRIQVVLTREGALQLLPRVEVPTLPHFGFTFTMSDLPKWSLDGFTFSSPDLKFFQLPFQASLGVNAVWSPQPKADFSIVNGELKLATTPSTLTVTLNGAQILTAKDVNLTVNDNEIKVSANEIIGGTSAKILDNIDDLSEAFGPLKVTISAIQAEVNVLSPDLGGPVTLQIKLTVGRVLIQAHTDPSLVLALAATVELTYENGALTPHLTQLNIVEPYPIELALFAAHVIEDGGRRLLSFIQKIEIPTPGTPPTPGLPSAEALGAVLRRIADLAVAAAIWLSQQGIAAARTLAGLAEAVFTLLGEVITELADKLGEGAKEIGKYVIVEVRIDIDRRRLVQIVVTPSDPAVSTNAFTRSLLGFKLEMPYEFTPALVCDFDQGWMAIALQTHAGNDRAMTISTDLWLENDKTGTTEPVSGSEKSDSAHTPLLGLTVKRKQHGNSYAFALAGVKDGKAFFFKKLSTQPSNGGVFREKDTEVVAKGHLLLAARFLGLESIKKDDFDIEPKIDTNRILSLFRSAKSSASDSPGGLPDQLSQHIKIIEVGKPTPELPVLHLPIVIGIKISEKTVNTTVTLDLNLETLSVKLNAGRFDIGPLVKNEFDLLGLKGTFESKDKNTALEKPLFLDLSDGDPRLGLNKNARLDLAYDKLSNGGKGLGFSVDQFIVSRDGIDLTARVKSDEAVTLAGVDMPFRFDHGQLSVKRSQIQTFAITGHGNLPPTLVGEAKASIKLNFAQGSNGIILQAAEAVLDKSADPLRCEGTQFSITVTKLGLKFVEQAGYHFYFTLTGAAEFRPNSGSFADGLLKNLSSLKIVLNEAPLAADPRVLLKHIEFQVPVDPPKRSSFFDLFSFELRGVGFHPASDAFGGSPAFSISGQVNFTDFGDIVTPRFDFHKLWIAPAEAGQVIPRVRCDGLGVGLALGSMAEASGTAIAVDDKLPTLYKSDALPANVTAKGFLASGSLRIQGWASMSASMGFLELEKSRSNEKRQAFFLYLQRNDMAEKIPTPIGTIFLREVGFGFGYRYTLAGIAAADQAETPQELVKVLDEISKYQGSLDDVKAWLPTFDNAGMTLALRGLLSITSASSTSDYNEKGEKDLPNLILFDIVAALRTDLTFLMNVRAWVAYNYADWREAKQKKAAWPNNPNLTGYMYLSAPRREFLARTVSNPGAEVGNHPKLPKELSDAMKVVRWSSTLYIRPGLFHWEAGWPYELGFSIGDPGGNFYLAAEGGTVMRFEEDAVLYGVAFRARGFAKFEYSTGGDFGAAISARADFALGAKLIAYLSAAVAESMFYGVIALDVTVAFAVRMWLKTRWFNLSASFSQSLTIHVGIELLLESNALAARIEASVAVSAFGRTLSLGIGFILGDIGRLDMARLRVERFLALGLASSYPNPEAGVPVSRPAPLPEPSRAENTIKSDRHTENTAERVEGTKTPDQDGKDPLEMIGREFGDTHYWALLFPIRTGDHEPLYMVQLVPCDASVGGIDDFQKASHFYAPPLSGEDKPTYRVAGVLRNEILVNGNTKLTDRTASDGYWEITTDWTAAFGLHGAGENSREHPKLKEAFQLGCFMAAAKFAASIPDEPEKQYELTDIETIPWAQDVEPLPDDPEQVSIVLKAAARSRAECGPRWKRMLQIDEARSCFIATVADCAERLAAAVMLDKVAVKVDEDRVRELEFDPRAIGLTFVFNESRLTELFDLKANDNPLEPSKSRSFSVRTLIPRVIDQGKPDLQYSGKTNVRLFNPPKRMFRQLSPVLKYFQKEQCLSAKGMLLHWDLEARWTPSKSIYADPEYHLKHYRIERRIEGLKTDPSVVAPSPRIFEVKKADQIEIVLAKKPNGELLLNEQGQTQLRKRRYRSRLQFADDLQDVPEKLRAQLLIPVNGADRSLVPKEDKDWLIITDKTRIVYTVLPVDCAGTFGVPAPDIVIPITKPEQPEKSLLKAIARFQYDHVSVFEETIEPKIEFTIEEEEKEINRIDEDKPPELDKAHEHLQLRIRSERTVAVGVFGADALSQARAEPPVPGRKERIPTAGDTDITLRFGLKLKQCDCKEDLDKLKRDLDKLKEELDKLKNEHVVKITRIPRRLTTPKTPGKLLEGKEESTLYVVSKDDWVQLRTALDIGSSARVHAARLYIRPKPNSKSNETERHHLDPEWIPVQLQLQIFPKEVKAFVDGMETTVKVTEPAVDITVERFEHPLDVSFQALTTSNDNISPSCGRLYLYHPAPFATFEDFLKEAKQNTSTTVSRLRDGDRRTAVTLAWNARPADIGLAGETKTVTPEEASDRHSLIAGYDLFALDATTVPNGAENRPDWPERFVTPVGRVQRLPAAERGLEPSETGDFSRVEVLYPSETLRLQTAGFRKRRAVWFSPAESCLLWPKRVLRRSVLTLPDEVGIAALFARGRPARINVKWPNWPQNVGSEPTFALIVIGNDMPVPKPNDGFCPENLLGAENCPEQSNKFSVEQARQLLLSLVLDGCSPQVDELADEKPSAFANLKIELTACDRDGIPLGVNYKDKDMPTLSESRVEVNVSLAPRLHPIIADVLDLVQYKQAKAADRSQPTKHSYRRYEPVLDTVPTVNADTLNAFLDETPADRDPSGWGVLRTFGLAVAFRLYDVEEGRFLSGSDTLERLNDTLKLVLPRYKDVPQAIGAPFVNVMFTTDGLAETASFHGATPIKTDAVTHLWNNALALVQIELRPTPQPLTIGYQPEPYKEKNWEKEKEIPANPCHKRFVRYATLKQGATGKTLPPNDYLLVSAKTANVLIEIEPIAPTIGQTVRRVLLMNGRDGEKFPTNQSADTISSVLRLRPVASDQSLAYIRVTTFDPTKSLDRLDQHILVQHIHVEKDKQETKIPLHVEDCLICDDPIKCAQNINLPKQCSKDISADILVALAKNLPDESEGPWGRFADLPDTWLAALLFGDADPMPDWRTKRKPETTNERQIEQHLRDMPFGDTLATLMRTLSRTQDRPKVGELPDTPAKRLQLAASLGPWTRRFMERGSAAQVEQGKVGLAFAMLTRPNPWRVAANSEGQLSVTLFEKDRFGKMRKYAVRPFGRYENLVRAVEIHKQTAKAKAEKTLAPALSPPQLGEGAFLKSKENPLLQHFADVVVERTEPLAAPVIIAARRNDVTVDGVTRPGHFVEVILSRHPEEILSDANIPVDAGIVMRYIAAGLWREFATPKWASTVTKMAHKEQPIDLLERFGPFKNESHDYNKSPTPKGLQLAGVKIDSETKAPVYYLETHQVRGWYERHPDLWRGAYVLTLANLPYGFRLHATAHAAAGVVVSPTTVATIEEAGYSLALPWKKGKDGSSLPWHKCKVSPPSWRLDDSNEGTISIRWPLVRIIDGIQDTEFLIQEGKKLSAKEYWFGDEPAPAVYRLPDPAVSYRLSIETRDGRVRVGEAEFCAISKDPNGEARTDLYLKQEIGTRFRFKQPETSPLQKVSQTHYEQTVKLTLKDQGAKKPPEPREPFFSMATLTPLLQPSDLTVNPTDMQNWGCIAPLAASNGSEAYVALTITPPEGVEDPQPPPPPAPPPLPDQRWIDFKTNMENFIARLREYENGSIPQRVKDTAKKIRESVEHYCVNSVATWPGPKTGGDHPTALPVRLSVPWVLGLPSTWPHFTVTTAPANGWLWPDKPGRDSGLAWFREKINTTLSQAGEELKLVVKDALRNYALAWMAHDVAKRRHLDWEPGCGLPPIRRAAPADTTINGSDLPDTTNKPFDFIATVTLAAETTRTDAQVERVFATLMVEKYTADALETLVALWSEPQKSADIRMRWVAHTTIETPLSSLLGSGNLQPQVSTILLFKPALKSDTQLCKNAYEKLPDWLDEMTEEQLFGPGRRLLVQAFHGLAKPQEDSVERKE